MKNENRNTIVEVVDIIFTTVLNFVWFGVWVYIVFWLGYSGWWMIFPLLINFHTDRVLIEKRKVEVLNKLNKDIKK